MSKAMSKCIANGIKIYPKPVNNYQYVLVVSINDIEKRGTTLFSSKPTSRDAKWYDKIHSLYEQLSIKLK